MILGMTRSIAGWGIMFCASMAVAETGSHPVPSDYRVPVQIPYDAPPEPEFPDVERATPSPDVLSEQELKRAEALLPLLEGRQELYIIGEFVHMGKPVVPVLVKALKMPGTRLRYNAIETMSIIKDPRAVPYLLEASKETNDVTRVRAHALRVAVRLAPMEVIPTFRELAKDEHETIRRAVAFEARHVRRPEVMPILIELLADGKTYVSVTARDSFWRLTRWAGPPHDWQGSTHEQRRAWAREWKAWWEEALKNRGAAPKKPQQSEPAS